MIDKDLWFVIDRDLWFDLVVGYGLNFFRLYLVRIYRIKHDAGWLTLLLKVKSKLDYCFDAQTWGCIMLVNSNLNFLS